MSQTFAAQQFTTSDGVTLHYLETGQKHKSGPALVFLPGWTLSASGFRHQLSDFSATHRCLALDYRGHGLSDCPDHGFRISRFAKDVLEFLDHADVPSAVLIGHSAGCAVAWSFIDMFGQDRLHALVLCDQMIARVKRSEWSEEECRQYGASVGGDQAIEEAMALAKPDGTKMMQAFLEGMFTPRCSVGDRDGIVQTSLNVPRRKAIQLLLDVTFSDYRDLLPNIKIRTLCIGGRASHLGPEVMPYIAAQISGAKLEMMAAEDGGSHFMFVENPTVFNGFVSAFLDDHSTVTG